MRNESKLFPIEAATFKCVFEKVVTDRHISVSDIVFISKKNAFLAADSSHTYECRFEDAFGNFGEIVEANISIIVTHTSSWLWFWTRHAIAGPYIWNANLSPPRWLEGTPIK